MPPEDDDQRHRPYQDEREHDADHHGSHERDRQRERNDQLAIMARATAAKLAPGADNRPAGNECEDCGFPDPELGRKCRACYLRWRDGRHHINAAESEELLATRNALVKWPLAAQKRLADVLLGRTQHVTLTGADAEMAVRVKNVLAGGFGPSMKNILEGIAMSKTGKTGKDELE